jgi:hypothetical protein
MAKKIINHQMICITRRMALKSLKGAIGRVSVRATHTKEKSQRREMDREGRPIWVSSI